MGTQQKRKEGGRGGRREGNVHMFEGRVCRVLGLWETHTQKERIERGLERRKARASQRKRMRRREEKGGNSEE